MTTVQSVSHSARPSKPAASLKVDSAEAMATLEAMSSHHNFRPGQQNLPNRNVTNSRPGRQCRNAPARVVRHFRPGSGTLAPSWRIGDGGLRFAHPPYELLGKNIHAQYRSITPRLGNEAR